MTLLEACLVGFQPHMYSDAALRDALTTLRGVSRCNVPPAARSAGVRGPAAARWRIKREIEQRAIERA